MYIFAVLFTQLLSGNPMGYGWFETVPQARCGAWSAQKPADFLTWLCGCCCMIFRDRTQIFTHLFFNFLIVLFFHFLIVYFFFICFFLRSFQSISYFFIHFSFSFFLYSLIYLLITYLWTFYLLVYLFISLDIFLKDTKRYIYVYINKYFFKLRKKYLTIDQYIYFDLYIFSKNM